MSTSVPDWLAEAAPGVEVLGDAALLAARPVAVVVSRQCPGALLLAAADWADAWASRPDRPVLASGFQTPAEAEVLRRLLRVGSRALKLPARRLPRRVPTEERAALDAGCLAYVSPFSARRPTAALADQRNALLARVARAAIVLHAAPASRTLGWASAAAAAGLPLFTLDHPANAPLRDLGAEPIDTLADHA